jgi:hypothetical protein
MAVRCEIAKPVDEVILRLVRSVSLWPWFDLSDEPKLNALWNDYKTTRLKACIPVDWPARDTKAIILRGYDPDAREKVEATYYPKELINEAKEIGNYEKVFKEKGFVDELDGKPRSTLFDGALLPYRSFAQARCALVNAIAKHFGVEDDSIELISFPEEQDDIV